MPFKFGEPGQKAAVKFRSSEGNVSEKIVRAQGARKEAVGVVVPVAMKAH